MVKISLQVKATLEFVEEFYTNHPDYSFILKLKCSSCGDCSDKWHDITESEKFPSKSGKTETNYFAKCKLCGRENSLDIIEGTNGKYSNSGNGTFKSIVTFDCRGIEPVEFKPGEGWIAKIEESGKLFTDIDLSEKEWVEYDDKIKESVGIYEFQSQFIKVK